MSGTPRTVPKIVIAGGGAGGLELAVALGRRARRQRGMAEIVLLDRFASHFWKPRLHEVAAGTLAPEDAAPPFAMLAARHGFRFIQGRMDRLDTAERQIGLADPVAPAGSADTISVDYDYLVLALGSEVNDFHTPGVDIYCDMLDDVPQAEHLYRRIWDRTHGARRHGARLGVAIIGAGATGVELAAELRAEAGRHEVRLDITVIDLADRPLPAGSAALSRSVARRLERQGIELVLGSRVVEVTNDSVRLADGRVIEVAVKVWASGVKAPDWLRQCKSLELTPDNRIKVDASLRCLGHASLFAMGDCAAFTAPGGSKPLPPTAQAAHQQGRYLARALPRRLRGAPLGTFHYRDYGILVSLGKKQVIGEAGAPARLRLRGAVARLLYEGLYQAHLAVLFGWPRTARMLALRFAQRTPGIALKLHNISPSG